MTKRSIRMLFGWLVVGILAYPVWKPLAKRNKWFVILTNVGQDTVRRLHLRSDQIGQFTQAQRDMSKLSLDLTRIQGIYRQYLKYAKLRSQDVAGIRMLELGPGFNIGVQAMFAADGAEQAAGLDKFVPLQEGPYFQELYTNLRATLDPKQQENFDRALQIKPQIKLNPQYLTYSYGKDITEGIDAWGAQAYDLIASNAVLEEIYDPLPVFDAQDRLLKPGGLLVHRIDLRDYGMFSKHGFHPLEFLTIPDWTYRYMVESSGQPNRWLAGDYCAAVARRGYQTEIWVTTVLGRGDLPEPKVAIEKGVDYYDQSLALISEIRPRLLDRYQSLPDQELLTQSIILVARKPSRPSAVD